MKEYRESQFNKDDLTSYIQTIIDEVPQGDMFIVLNRLQEKFGDNMDVLYDHKPFIDLVTDWANDSMDYEIVNAKLDKLPKELKEKVLMNLPDPF